MTAPSRQLLVATTGEPMQPVRLTYALACDKSKILTALEALRCVTPGRVANTLEWLHCHEAAALDFSKWAQRANLGRAPALLGVWHLAEPDALALTLRSFHRAVLAARFFAPRLGPDVVLMRARIVNRWFAAGEMGPSLDLGLLDAHLDRNVMVQDPRVAERRLKALLSQARSREHLERLLAEDLERRRKTDVPEVEDFPLAPEEETPDFRDLETTLMLRMIRASEHWQGRTHVTLADIIIDATKQKNAKEGSPRKA
jgi:hypothetical protein